MSHQYQYVVLFFHFKKLLLELAKKDILVAPLKGAHLLASVYPQGQERGKISDVDFLVREKDWREVLATMEEMGFRRRSSKVDETVSHEVGLRLPIGKDGYILFEAHRSLFDERRIRIDHDAIWNRAVPAAFDGAPCLSLAPEDHFCHLAFHELVHRLHGMERTITDLRLLVEGAGDWVFERIVQRSRQWGVSRSAWFFLDLLAREAEMKEAEKYARELAPSTPVRKAVRALVPNSKVARLTPLHHRIQAALLWPLLMDSLPKTMRFAANHPLVRHYFN